MLSGHITVSKSFRERSGRGRDQAGWRSKPDGNTLERERERWRVSGEGGATVCEKLTTTCVSSIRMKGSKKIQVAKNRNSCTVVVRLVRLMPRGSSSASVKTGLRRWRGRESLSSPYETEPLESNYPCSLAYTII